MMAAEEASLTGGVFGRILAFYERSMRRSLRHPFAVAALCVVLIAASYLCYRALGSDLLPAFDEGGFVLDYVMPPGSSLQETEPRPQPRRGDSARDARRSRAPRGARACNWDSRP